LFEPGALSESAGAALGAAMAVYDTALQYAKTASSLPTSRSLSHQLVQEKLAWMIY